MIKTGLYGTIIAAICCFTPALVILLGLVGLSSLVPWLDLFLIPALVLFIVILGIGLWQKHKAQSN